MRLSSLATVSLAVLLVATIVPARTSAAEIDGRWDGAIEVPGQPLVIDVDFVSAADGTISGDISIPVQQLHDHGLSAIAVDGDRVTFSIPGIPGEPSFDGTVDADGTTLSGTFTQGGASLTFSLARGASPATRARQALEGFDTFVQQAIEAWNVPGTAVGIVAGGEVVFAQGFGHRDREADLPMTPDSLFAIGSTTKAFTATLLGMLADEGVIDWDAPLRTYLPAFTLQDPLATIQISPRDLVTHRSGLPRHDLLWYNNHVDSRADLIARFAHLEPTAALREKFQYNNLMFMTAGYLAGQRTGGTWEEALRARILDPLGMTRTTFSVDDSQRDADFAQPYRENDDDQLERIPFRRIDVAGPAGSLNSSVREMSKWLLFNLQGGRVDGESLIDQATLNDIHAPHMTTGQPSDRADISAPSYGMGWGIDTYRGHRRVAHGGGIDGFITSVMLFPDDQLGIVTFTNRGSGLPPLLAQHAADRVLGLETVDWSGEALALQAQGEAAGEQAEEKKDAARIADTAPSHPLADYVGTYENDGYGRLEVAQQDARLVLTYNDIVTPLEHWHYDVFNGHEDAEDPALEDQKFLFHGDVDGNIATVSAIFEVQTDPIVFRKAPPARLSDPAFLDRLVGAYTLPTQVATITRSGTTLKAHLPGQPTYTLEPRADGRFVLVEVSIVSIEFHLEGNDGPATGISIHQPQGVFDGKRVEP